MKVLAERRLEFPIITTGASYDLVRLKPGVVVRFRITLDGGQFAIFPSLSIGRKDEEGESATIAFPQAIPSGLLPEVAVPLRLFYGFEDTLAETIERAMAVAFFPRVSVNFSHVLSDRCMRVTLVVKSFDTEFVQESGDETLSRFIELLDPPHRATLVR